MKQNSKSQARTKADSEQKDEDMFVSQHSRKPNVMRSPLSSEIVLIVLGVLFFMCYSCVTKKYLRKEKPVSFPHREIKKEYGQVYL